MPRGGPDYYNNVYALAVSQQDPSNVMAALTGINTLDGLGRVIYWDNFQSSLLKWIPGKFGTAAYPVIDTTLAEVGNQSVKFVPGGANVSERSLMFRSFGVRDGTSVGAECSLYMLGNWDLFEIDIDLLYLTTHHYVELRIDHVGNRIQIYTASDYVTIMSDISWSFMHGWLGIKLVYNPVTNKLERVIIGQNEIDCSMYDMYTDSIPNELTVVQITMFAWPTARHTDKVNVGHFILTTDEP
jgi:hypothetical protein